MVQGTRGLKVEISTYLEVQIDKLCNEDRRIVFSLIAELQRDGFDRLPGLLKPSNSVNKDQHDWLERVSLANQYNLWHYHIGIPRYDKDKPRGRWTSSKVIHLIPEDGKVTLVSIDDHPPFNLPNISILRSL